jgi:hypothetical protein
MITISGHSDDVICVDFEKSGYSSFHDEYYFTFHKNQKVDHSNNYYSGTYLHFPDTGLVVLCTFGKGYKTWEFEVVRNPGNLVTVVSDSSDDPDNIDQKMVIPDGVITVGSDPFSCDGADGPSEDFLREWLENVDWYRIADRLKFEDLQKLYAMLRGK